MRRFFLIAPALLLLLLTACGKPPVHTQEAFVFGTRVEVLIADGDAVRAKTVASAVLQEFDRLHRTYHAWQPSELTALNGAVAAGKTHPVSIEMTGFIADAQRIAADGEHLFDPGIGKLIQLWGFQSEEFRPVLPDPAALAEWQKATPSIAQIRLESGQASSSNRQVAIDFGGYLKGVALDRASAMLRAQGIQNALINIGGNVMALGSKHGESWRVGIQHPRQPGALATLQLHDGEAIGTSGDYQRYFELDGKRYCHLLDPRSAMPVTHTQSLTVLISSRPQAGMLSDAGSKPLFIAGRADWPRLARRMAVADVLRVDADGRLQVSRSLATRLKFEPGVPAPEIIE